MIKHVSLSLEFIYNSVFQWCLVCTFSLVATIHLISMVSVHEEVLMNYFLRKRNELLRITFKGNGGKYERGAQLVGRKDKREDGKGRREMDTDDISEKWHLLLLAFNTGERLRNESFKIMESS